MFKKIPSITINALMMVLLVAMLALPITGLGLTGYRQIDPSAREVLSAQDCVPQGGYPQSLEAEKEYYKRMIEQVEIERALRESEAVIEITEPSENEIIETEPEPELEEEASEDTSNQE